MDTTARIDIEWQCRNLCFEFGYFTDQRLYSQLADLFTDDGVFDRMGQILSGRNAIVEALSTRPPDLTTRNVCGNVVFTELTTELARAVVYNVVFFSGHDNPLAEPARYGASQGVFWECRDLYRPTPGGWRFAERVARRIFVPADMPQWPAQASR